MKPHTLSAPLASLFRYLLQHVGLIRGIIYTACIEKLLREQEKSLTQCCNPHLVLTKYLAFRNSNNINSSSNNNDAKLKCIYVELNSTLMQNFRDLGHV